MADFYGADVEQLRQLARKLEQEAEQLESVVSRLTTRITSVAWNGPDANRFSGDWSERLAPMMRRVATGLRDASGQAMGDARQQEETSSGSGSAFILPDIGNLPMPRTLPQPIPFDREDYSAPFDPGSGRLPSIIEMDAEPRGSEI